MGSYFRCYQRKKFIIKTLIKKRGGSPYPNSGEFNKKIALLKKYLADFVPKTEINYDGKYIRVKQTKILGEDLFGYLNNNKHEKPKRYFDFVQKLSLLYRKTGILPDLLNKGNILITKNREIKLIDIWPLFFKERVITGDINKESYRENLEKLNFLKKFK